MHSIATEEQLPVVKGQGLSSVFGEERAGRSAPWAARGGAPSRPPARRGRGAAAWPPTMAGRRAAAPRGALPGRAPPAR